MITNPVERITFGDTLIHASGGWVAYPGEVEFPFEFCVFSDAASFGDPEPEMTEVPSSLLDGVIVTTNRNANRMIEFSVGVRSKTAEGLSRGERVLMGECNKARGALRRNSLMWEPPQPEGRATVYEALEAHLGWEFDDEQEMLQRRVFRLELTCAPFGRGRDEVVVPALSTGDEPVFVTIDGGSSLSGWSATVAGSAVTLDGPPPAVAVEPVRTNLVENGTFRLTSAPWRASTGSESVTRRESAGGRSGGVLDVQANWGSNFGTVKWSYASPGVGFPVVAGQRVDVRYKYRFQNDPEEGPMPAGFLYRYRNASREQIGADQFYSATPFSGTAWRDVAVKLPPAPAGAATVQVIPRLGASYTIAGRWYIDDFMVATSTHATTVGAYFDGDTPESSEGSYWWTGAPYASTSVAGPPGPTALTRTGTVDFTGTPYLHVDFYSTQPGDLTVRLNGGEPLQMVDLSSINPGLRRAVFLAGDVSATSITIASGSDGALAPSLFVSGLHRSNIGSSAVGSGRQLVRAIDVRGTARAPASLHLAHPSQGLGHAVLYTSADDSSGYSPPTAQYRNASLSTSVRTVDTSTVSGARHTVDIGQVEVRDVPVDRLPEGVYEVLAIVRRTGSDGRAFTWSAATVLGGVEYGEYSSFKSVDAAAMGSSNQWMVVSLGHADLPPASTQGEGVVRVRLQSNLAFVVDEILLANLSIGEITRVNAGSYRRLWVDSPTLDRPRRSIWLGNAEDRSDARHTVDNEVQAWGSHQLLPGRVNAFSMTSGAVSAGLSMRQYEWFMHNASTYAVDDGEE